MSSQGSAAIPAQHKASDWRQLIADAVAALWPGLDLAWIEAQVHIESLGDPRALSGCGAQGLLQLMPATAAELGITNPFDPAENLHGGIAYLRLQFEALTRVPDEQDRLLWSFASYNGGRGWINRALALAEFEGERPWSTWEPNWRYLFHRECERDGRRPDYRQIHAYVARIQAQYRRLRGQS